MNMGESSDMRINVPAGVVRSQAEDSLTVGDALILSDHKAVLPVLEDERRKPNDTLRPVGWWRT